MSRTAIILLVAAFAAAIPCCGNDPRIVDAKMSGGSDGSGSGSTMMCTGSNPQWQQMCNDDSTCMGCTCHMIGHFSYCTKTCTTPAECPAPATTCYMGFCQQ